MLIAEEYFNRLLKSEDALHAVSELQRTWCTRPGRSESKPCFGLAHAEYVVHLAILYDGEVCNGGHQQYLLNPSGAYVADTLRALNELGLTVRMRALDEARTLFASGDVPLDWKSREASVSGFDERSRAKLDQLDQTVWSSAEDVNRACLEYLRRNSNKILRPERGLDVRP